MTSVRVGDHFLQVFGMRQENEGRVVSGYVQAKPGTRFEVVFYDGRDKKSSIKGHEVSLFFGDDECVPLSQSRPVGR